MRGREIFGYFMMVLLCLTSCQVNISPILIDTVKDSVGANSAAISSNTPPNLPTSTSDKAISTPEASSTPELPQPTLHVMPLPSEIFSSGGLIFADSGQRLGEERSWSVALGDLDGDGDLDAFVVNAYFSNPKVDKANRVWMIATP